MASRPGPALKHGQSARPDRPRSSPAIGLLVMAGVPIGRLPGDFYVRRGSFSFYFPLTTSIIVSIIADPDLRLLSTLNACPSNPTPGSSGWRSSTR